MLDFYKSIAGRRFFEGDVPRLVESGSRLADTMTTPVQVTRPCIVLVDLNTTDKSYEATFHRWAECITPIGGPVGGFGQQTRGIVEYSDGRVAFESPEFICFTDREKPE